MISFVIAAKNEEGYIADCLKSVFSQELGTPFEVIVVDNHSSDGTTELVASQFPQARLIIEEQQGSNAARHRGYAEAKGDLVIFLDADVRLPAGWLAKVVKRFEASAGLAALSSHYIYYDFPWYLSFAKAVLQYGIYYPWVYLTNNLLNLTATIVGGVIVIRAEALRKIGGLDTSSVFFGDEVLLAKKLRMVGQVRTDPRYWVYCSGRRYLESGVLRTMFRYLLNYFWTLFTGHPYHKGSYEAIR